jgi:hypothetical protein
MINNLTQTFIDEGAKLATGQTIKVTNRLMPPSVSVCAYDTKPSGVFVLPRKPFKKSPFSVRGSLRASVL